MKKRIQVKPILKQNLKRVPGIKAFTERGREIHNLRVALDAEQAHKKELQKELKLHRTWIEPGHFYSPITNTVNFKHLGYRDTVPGVELHTHKQRALIKKLARFYKEQPFKNLLTETNRYYFVNDQFSYSDALVLYAMLRHYKPKRVIEVGSGFSSALMLDVNNQFMKDSMELTFIEPYPTRLKSLLRKSDKARVLKKFVQNVPLEEFQKLEAGDILFIDSSHVSKAGSDVNWLYFEVLPILKPGVIIHIHDIFYPFEYIDRWIKQGRSWNEAYVVHAILQYSTVFQIELWPHYLHMFYPNEIQSGFPLSRRNTGGSIWIRKVT